jgi:hypothetical protein
MSVIRKALIGAGCLMLINGTAYAAPPDWNKGSTDEKIKALSDIQPGVGTVMIEYSRRMSALYYAAMGGNWGMAGYQLKEMPEIQEVGEATRPKRAKDLKKFENDYLVGLSKAVEGKDYATFQASFFKTVDGCNGCHVDSGFEFIHYVLPNGSPSPTSNKPQPKKGAPKSFELNE